MVVGETVTLSNDCIKAAYNLSIKAKSHSHLYQLTTRKDAAASTIIAFKPSMEVQHFYSDDHFGETKVDDKLFTFLQRIGEGLYAKVNAAVLQKFNHLLNSTGFKSEVEKALKQNKEILFTGHSSGGAIASLATLWVLEQYRRKQKLEFKIGCITFGSPLIGDGTVAHAVRREKWAGHFTHFVMEHDIVPRMMLAPKTSVQPQLEKVNSITTGELQQPVDGNDAASFLENVLINALTVASHDAFDLMEPTSSLKEKLSVDIVKVSPYRPFGVYVFCTRDEDLGLSAPRQQLVAEDPNAVLQLLVYFCQLPNEDQDLAEFAQKSLNEHFSYEDELKNNGLQLGNWVHLEPLIKQLTSEGTNVGTKNKALYELTPSAKLCLLAVEEAEKRKKQKADEIKESMRNYKSPAAQNPPKIIEDLLDTIIKYKEKHGDETSNYYEAFKLQNLEADFDANVNRLEQAKIWDVVIEKVKRRELPDDFEVWAEFLELATQFRRLYEPLDIANYYRHKKGEGYNVGDEMRNRPKRYKFPQRWHQYANGTAFDKVSESNFVAEVEELMKEVTETKKKPIEEVKKEFEIIKSKVKEWQSDEKIKKADVFWGGYTLSKLDEKLAQAN